MAVSRSQDQEAKEGCAAYEELEGEYKACRQHLRSKEQALRILQEQLKKADLNSQRLKQEIKQLRSQLSRSQQVPSPVRTDNPNTKNTFSLLNEDLVQEKEVLIHQLESAQGHVSELERQVKELEDEKEEVASERGYFSTKCESLLKCLEEERMRQPPSHSALQTLLDENGGLRLTLVEAEADRDHARSKIERYKRAVERKKVVEAASEQVVTLADRKQDLKLAVKRINELESLANSLSQSVKEKSVTITHQKRANKALAMQVAELEHQVKVLEVSQALSGGEDKGSVSAGEWGEQVKEADRKLTDIKGDHMDS